MESQDWMDMETFVCAVVHGDTPYGEQWTREQQFSEDQLADIMQRRKWFKATNATIPFTDWLERGED